MNAPVPSRTIEGAPVLTIFFLFLGVLFLRSQFFTAYGISIDLPTAETSTMRVTHPTSSVVLLDSGYFLFQENIMDDNELAAALERLSTSSDGAERVLRIYCDRRVPMETFLRVATTAKRAGFSSI
ncbi:MAG: biopolymer transporter ExbD, partial [Puniceicoccales bacterium]|nr:biopolymer transporter ExbD [Puniceicoccales bacterium]